MSSTNSSLQLKCTVSSRNVILESFECFLINKKANGTELC